MNESKDERSALDVLATILGILVGIGIALVIWKVLHS